MKTLWVACLLASISSADALAPAISSSAPPPNPQPAPPLINVGVTSYTTLPFQGTVYQAAFGASPDLNPAQLYFRSNLVGSLANFFSNATNRANAAGSSAIYKSQGIVPRSGTQRWEDTYEASFPNGTFPPASCPSGGLNPITNGSCLGFTSASEPTFIVNDRNAGNFPNRLDFVAWRNFITNHPQYVSFSYDSGTVPADATYFRTWGGEYGHIEPGTPLDPWDCPPGMRSCVYGDLFAYQWGLSAQLSGAFGSTMSDFTDSVPERGLWSQDFNQRVIDSFAKTYHYGTPNARVPGYPSISSQATYIVANDFNRWVDFFSTSYAKFYAAFAARLSAATGTPGLIIDQCGDYASYRRTVGLDQRIIAQVMSPAQYICIWDEQTIQVGRSGPIVNPIMQELDGSILAAAREPLIRNGANLEAFDTAYTNAIAAFYPSLSGADQTEVGQKLLKRLWSWMSFAHIADRNGNIRRALCFVSRDYSDIGNLTALDPLTSVIQSVVPTKPFGAAIYYSVPLERAVEQTQGSAVGAGNVPPAALYMQLAALQTFLDGGTAVGYYVSDAALPKITHDAGNAPFAWMVFDPSSQLTTAESNQLTVTAPVVKSASALAALSNQPITFSNGLTGFAFFDQNNRLVIVVSNPSPAAAAGSITGNIVLAGTGISNGSHTVTDLLSGGTTPITFSSGGATIPETVTRWDTLILAVTP